MEREVSSSTSTTNFKKKPNRMRLHLYIKYIMSERMMDVGARLS